MSTTTITLDLPENLYLRLQQTAEATRQSLDAVLMRALQVGSPPTWETAPAEFQADLAALDRLDETNKNVTRVQEGDKFVPDIECGEGRWLGVTIDGAYAPYMRVPEQVIYRVPDHVSLDYACVAEPIVCDDGNQCTAPDACVAGVCSGTPVAGCCGQDADCADPDDAEDENHRDDRGVAIDPVVCSVDGPALHVFPPEAFRHDSECRE